MTYFLVITAIAHLFMFVNTMTGKIWTVYFDRRATRTEQREAKQSNAIDEEKVREACFVLEFLRFTFNFCGKAFGFWNEMILGRRLQIQQTL